MIYFFDCITILVTGKTAMFQLQPASQAMGQELSDNRLFISSIDVFFIN